MSGILKKENDDPASNAIENQNTTDHTDNSMTNISSYGINVLETVGLYPTLHLNSIHSIILEKVIEYCAYRACTNGYSIESLEFAHSQKILPIRIEPEILPQVLAAAHYLNI